MSGIRRLLVGGELPVSYFWDIPHNRVRTKRGEFQTDAAYQDWFAYQALPDGKLEWPKRIEPLRGARKLLGRRRHRDPLPDARACPGLRRRGQLQQRVLRPPRQPRTDDDAPAGGRRGGGLE